MNTQENIPDKIRSAGRNLPFEVPESYFDRFPERVQQRIRERRIPTYRLLKPQLAVAAMFIGLIAVGYAGFRIFSNQGESPYLSDEELNHTIEFFAYEIDDEMLISAMIESDISFSAKSFDLLGDEIIQYLTEEDIDISDLVND